MASANNRRLVLHFDLNSTILMLDTACNLNVVETIQRIVCKSAWGAMVGKGADATWHLCHDSLCQNQPDEVNGKSMLPEEVSMLSDTEWKLIDYDSFVKEVIPEDEDKKEDAEAKAEVGKKRTEMRAQFATPSGPGSKFKAQQDKMLKAMLLPKAAKDQLGFVGDEMIMEEDQEEEKVLSDDEDAEAAAALAKKKNDREMYHRIFSEGRYHIIPGFFRTLMYLKKQKRDFVVAFRTFGTDLPNLTFEFNKFCEGEHPLFNGQSGTPFVKLDGSKGSRDLRLNKPQQQDCKFYRRSDKMEDMMFVQGPHTRNADSSAILTENNEAELFRDHMDIYSQFMDIVQKNGSIGIQDDYQGWVNSKFDCRCSKPLIVDQADYNTQHIFFDDYAKLGRDCAIDVRDVITGKPLPQSKFRDQYVVQADPIRAILETDYFIKSIEMCEEKRDAEIKRIESGIEDTSAVDDMHKVELSSEEKNQIEWDKLMGMTDGDYLMRTVLPVLYQGIRVVDLERPAAPLEYLSMYLLKHQGEIATLPTKPLPKPKVEDVKTRDKSALSVQQEGNEEPPQSSQ